jgi:ferric-dicitrate binding protein FerR (iron transport regulator)
MNQDIIRKYLAGDADPAEKKEIAAWTNADGNNLAEFRALRKLYDIALWTVEADKSKSVPFQQPKDKKTIVYRIISIAATVALLLSFSYTSWVKQQIPTVVKQTIHVPAGQRAELVLADGTNVWLNAGTTFTFPNHFSSKERAVQLDGEGYFKVTKDAQKPFIVKTAMYNVTALGTEFNILSYSKSPLFEVSLLNGLVEVVSGDRKVRLEPDTKLWKSGDSLLKENIKNYDYLLWKDGLISFDNESVEMIVSKLELYFDTRIIVENKSFMKRRYTGKFRTKDGIEHILKVFRLKDSFIYLKDDEANVIIIK